MFKYIFIGLPVPAIPAGLPCRTRKLTTKKHKTLLTEDQDSEISSECSDDSDDDWVPGSEEARKRKKMNKRFIPGNHETNEVSNIYELLSRVVIWVFKLKEKSLA